MISQHSNRQFEPKKDQAPASSKWLPSQEARKQAEQDKIKRSSGCGCGKKYGRV